MCGITGIYAFNQVGSFYMINMAKAIDAMAQRGPDARGYFLDDYIGLGHRRLSIIDTGYVSNQPMYDESRRYVLVFNGEIFNYKELKKELVDKGITFQTESDTEVLLQYYILEKEKCLTRFLGFFAFAIYDKEEKSLFIARDRMGVKPLLFYKDEDKFVFSSEMKSLLAYNIPRALDEVSLFQYLQLNYVPKEHSIFKNIYRLLPGECLLVKGKEFIKKRYYDIPYSEKTINRTITFEESKEKLLELLEDSVRLRLISDVPLGAFLSGGTDSSAIVALASRHTNYLNTFSIGFKDEPFFDETKYANLVAKKFNTNHTVFSLTNQDLHEHIFEVLDYLDEPFADSSALPFYILSKRTSGKVKVALSGDGADELFAGYNKYYAEYEIRQGGWKGELLKTLYPVLDKLPKSRNSFFSNKIRQYHRFAEGANMTAKDRYWKWSTVSTEKDISTLFSKEFIQKVDAAEYKSRKSNCTKNISEPGSLNEVLLSDVTMVLPDNMLFKADMMSMANGLEVREPFLDHRLVDFAFSLPVEYKIDNQLKKKIVRDAFKDILPQELYDRPKKGFDVPLIKFYKRELRSLILELLDENFIKAQGIFDSKEIKKLKNNVLNGQYYEQEAVWNIIAFQYWWRKFLSK
ncbi:MAG TPA: asparagine synthase (glutamine-hydrolyzing) [Cytophagaceae bacterium]|jgi:asparagine synthase (glutamine-hydrolysing)|nr:asparagine synthase (glutamine-hydrolyzing) [Cytophagaceae bacterium]